MLNILMYLLFSYGLSNMLVFGMGPYDLLDRIRIYSKKIFGKLGNMLDCMMCTSANIGWVVSLLNILFLPTISLTPMMILYGSILPWYVLIFGDLCITSGAVWIVNAIVEALERSNSYEQSDAERDTES